MKPIHAAALLAATCLASPVFASDGEQKAPDVIVTAQANPEDPPVVAEARERLARTPGSVSVVAAEAYEDRFAVGTPDILRDVPGVLAAKRYGEEGRLSIRGSGLDQSFHQRGVLLAQDGVPFADADGFSDFQKIDPLGARYVEVYKGGNALRFGGAQLGGAINFVTPNGKTAQSPFLFRLEGGSDATVRGAAAGSGTAGAFDYYAGVNAFHSDGYRVQGWTDQLRATVNLGYSFGEDSEVRAILYAADIGQGVPGTVTLAQALNDPRAPGATTVAQNQRRDQNVYRATLQTRLRLSDGLVFEGGVYATQTDLYHPVGIFILQDTDTQGAFGRFDWSGELAGLKSDLFFGAFYREGGTEQDLFVNMASAQGPRIGDTKQVGNALDLFAEGRVFVTPELALVAGASWGHAGRDYSNHLTGGTAERSYEWFAPRAGLLFERGGVQVYANVTRSVEPPHFGALAQTNLLGSVFVPLDPQRAWTAEAGTRGRSGAVAWDVTYYHAWVKGELLSFQTSPTIPATVFNADKTRHQGVEASLDWWILDGAAARLRLRQTYAWSDFRFDGDPIYGDNRLPIAPVHQYRASLRYEGGGGLFVEPSLDWRPRSTWADYRNSFRVPGYATFGVGAGIELGNGLTVFVDARNLTDKHYVSDQSAAVAANDASAIFHPGEGRTVLGGLRARF
ncbi:TonB-dependent receptor [Sphingomonas sp. BT-65]|uniref:TonB-dependent receptor family protein n=1 Tax=Sphingomonas sp. BT-65 TaxID=2989821 RepID=UPI002235EF9A|nr:TonB-dependent receptor [Sphingomonas sp. BT-65]MCW4463213.1 TonB-dependent receptor [Sphingomonas sp. BT-65]